MATATPRCTASNTVTDAPSQCALRAGCALSPAAHAARSASVTVAPGFRSFVPSAYVMSTSTVRWNTGTAHASTIRRAATLRMPLSGVVVR